MDLLKDIPIELIHPSGMTEKSRVLQFSPPESLFIILFHHVDPTLSISMWTSNSGQRMKLQFDGARIFEAKSYPGCIPGLKISSSRTFTALCDSQPVTHINGADLGGAWNAPDFTTGIVASFSTAERWRFGGLYNLHCSRERERESL